jgi:hypothetical protein
MMVAPVAVASSASIDATNWAAAGSALIVTFFGFKPSSLDEKWLQPFSLLHRVSP